jgi:hypothetical protein
MTPRLPPHGGGVLIVAQRKTKKNVKFNRRGCFLACGLAVAVNAFQKRLGFTFSHSGFA